MRTKANGRTKRRDASARDEADVSPLPRRTPGFTLLAIGALLGAALMVAVRELAGGVEPVAVARDTSNDTIASIESLARVYHRDATQRPVHPVRVTYRRKQEEEDDAGFTLIRTQEDLTQPPGTSAPTTSSRRS